MDQERQMLHFNGAVWRYNELSAVHDGESGEEYWRTAGIRKRDKPAIVTKSSVCQSQSARGFSQVSVLRTTDGACSHLSGQPDEVR